MQARAWIHVRWTGPHGGPVSLPALHALLFQLKGATATTARCRPGWRGAATPSGSATSRRSRFWHFQLIEGGWRLALALLLGVATVWLVRHKAA